MLTVGEVRTGLLQNATSVAGATARAVLGILRDEPVRTAERPVPYAVSPEVLTGVDCRLATASGARPRAVGTVSSRAVLTGGRVLQGSSVTRLAGTELDRRMPWSHYLARPGVTEVIGRVSWPSVAAGVLDAPRVVAAPNLAAISDRVMDTVQEHPELDGRPPFKAARTTLRWIVEAGPEIGDASFAIAGESLRTLRLSARDDDLAAIVGLCEDIALHDWLLSTLTRLVEHSRLGSGPGFITRLRPAVDHLLHLWLPGARVADVIAPVWAGLERRPGFTRQWDLTVNRLRDQIAVTTVGLLSAASEQSRKESHG